MFFCRQEKFFASRHPIQTKCVPSLSIVNVTFGTNSCRVTCSSCGEILAFFFFFFFLSSPLHSAGGLTLLGQSVLGQLAVIRILECNNCLHLGNHYIKKRLRLRYLQPFSWGRMEESSLDFCHDHLSYTSRTSGTSKSDSTGTSLRILDFTFMGEQKICMGHPPVKMTTK